MAVVEYLGRQGNMHDTGLVALDPRYFTGDTMRLAVVTSGIRTTKHLALWAVRGRPMMVQQWETFLDNATANSYVALSRVVVDGNKASLTGHCRMKWRATAQDPRAGIRVGGTTFIAELERKNGVWTIVAFRVHIIS